MASYVTIPIFVEAMDEGDVRRAKPARGRRRRGMASLRLFVWSVLVGMTIGTVMCVLEPERSMQVSASTRAWLKTAAVHATAAIDAVRPR
jgi:hypothetical protein